MSRPLLNRRLEGLGTTIFAEMSALRRSRPARSTSARASPTRTARPRSPEAAADAILAGRGNQYPPGPGVPELRQAIAAHHERFYGLRYDPDTEVLVTAGATEAIAAAMLALVEPGDEVIAFEPYYDSYAACIAMAGGVRVPVTLRPPDFRLDLDELRAAVTPAHPADPAQHPAQPDRHGLHPRRARRDRRAGRRARPARGHRRGLRAPGLRRRARADRDVPRHAGADGLDQLGGQDVLLHRLEDRLGHRPRRSW